MSDIALTKPLPPGVGDDLMAYVGCIAGAIPVNDYRAGLTAAGFAAVEVVPTGAVVGGLPLVAAECCTPAPTTAGTLHERLADLLRRYDVNDYAASVRVYAVKPE